MAEATIVVKMRDQFSSSANRMETANKGFNKSLEDTNRKAEQYRKRLDETVRAMAKLETELQSARAPNGKHRRHFVRRQMPPTVKR